MLASHREGRADAGGRQRRSCACWRARRPARRFASTRTFSTGPRRAGDVDGPENYHVVLLDNGRSAMLGSELRGHAALHPLRRLHESLPGLSCGRRPRLRLGLSRPDGRGAHADADRRRQGRASAERLDLLRALRERCPVKIPLPKIMRHWREREFERHLTPATLRAGLGLWAFFAKRPALYRFATALAMPPWAWRAGAQGPLSLAAVRRRLDQQSRSARRRKAETFQARMAARATREGRMSARDDDSRQRSDAPSGFRERKRSGPADRWPIGWSAARKGVIPARGQVVGRCAAGLVQVAGRGGAGDRDGRCESAADVPQSIARFLRDHNLPATLRMGDDPRLRAMPWGDTAARHRARATRRRAI